MISVSEQYEFAFVRSAMYWQMSFDWEWPETSSCIMFQVDSSVVANSCALPEPDNRPLANSRYAADACVLPVSHISNDLVSTCPFNCKSIWFVDKCTLDGPRISSSCNGRVLTSVSIVAHGKHEPSLDSVQLGSDVERLIAGQVM